MKNAARIQLSMTVAELKTLILLIETSADTLRRAADRDRAARLRDKAKLGLK